MTTNRGYYKYCPIAQKVVPINEARSNAATGKIHLINDEMPATKHPIDKKHYTSKAKFREVTRAHGYEEVGTAYEKGYDPQPRQEIERMQEFKHKFINQLRERLNG